MTDFKINEAAFSLYSLRPEQTAALQTFFEQCADYTMLVEGEGVSPDAAQDTFVDLPPGKTLEDKFLYGVMDQAGVIIGVLEGMRHYPQDGIWWIGLFMLAPRVRGKGLGQTILDAFAEHVRAAGGDAIMLGVVEENQSGYRFWGQQGFEDVRQTEPRTFARKTQRVFIMRRGLDS